MCIHEVATPMSSSKLLCLDHFLPLDWMHTQPHLVHVTYINECLRRHTVFLGLVSTGIYCDEVCHLWVNEIAFVVVVVVVVHSLLVHAQ